MSEDTITSVSLGRAHSDDDALMPVSQLIIALDSDHPMAAPRRHLLEGLDQVTFGRGDALCHRDGRTLTLRLPDPRMSSDHGRLVHDGRRLGARRSALEERLRRQRAR